MKCDWRSPAREKGIEEDVMNICREGVIPPLCPPYQEIESEGMKVALISVAKGVDRPYYTSKNRYFIRVGSTKRIASREELVRLFQASGLFHYDLIEISDGSVSQLDVSAIADYFSQYKVSFGSEDEYEKIRLLIASDMLGENGRPTVGGALVFGINPEKKLPQAGISFANFSGKEIGADL